MNKRKYLLPIIVLLIFQLSCLNSDRNNTGVEVIKSERFKYNNIKDSISLPGVDSLQLMLVKTEDLALVGKLWGFLKYYHPNVASGNFNWDKDLLLILKILGSKGKDVNRDEILLNWVNSLGTFKTSNYQKNILKEIKIWPDLDWITHSELDADFEAALKKVIDAERPEFNHYVRQAKGASNFLFKNEHAYEEMKFPDAGYRLLALFRYWNIIQYYFPYKHLIEEDWNMVLQEFIPKFINAGNELEYQLTVLELIGRINDSHANIYNRSKTLARFSGWYFPPIRLTFVEGKAVVNGYYDEILGKRTSLKQGDVIVKVNNRPVEEIVKENLKYSPASNYATKLRSIAASLLRTNDSIIEVEFIRNGKTVVHTIKTYTINKFANVFSKDTCFKLLNRNAAYINFESLKNEYLPQLLKKIHQTKGLIIDLRGYPTESVLYSLGEYLMPKSIPFVRFTKGSIIQPGHFCMTDNLSIGKKNKNYYKGKVVIIVNEKTQSHAEFTAMAYRVAPNAIVIGSTTAGADGNVSEFYLPGGIKTMISGIGVYYPDGRETQRVGIIPDIEVKPTIKGIKEGRDEVLEKAIELINAK